MIVNKEMGNKMLQKKRYWIIGFILFILFLGAIFGESDDLESNQKENNENDILVEETVKTAEIKDQKENEAQEVVQREKKEDKQEKKTIHKKKDATTEQVKDLSDLKVHFIDVGQADATLFQFKNRDREYNLLFDAGDWNRRDVVNYLQSQGITTLDVVIISHPHADHIGQLEHIMNQFTVHEVWMSGNTASSQTFQRALEAVLASDANYEEPRAGDIYDIGPLTLEVLHPAHLSGDLNQDSISIRFVYGNVAFLLTGDAYKQNERAMMERASTIQANVLQLGHHGSNTSTDQQFLEAVNPDIAIYSAGSNNSYGHPHAEVVSLIQNKDIDLYGTDVHGTIIVTTDGKSLNVQTNKDGTISPEKTASNSTKGSSRKNQQKQPSPSKQKNISSETCVDINKASLEELQKIIHIGEVRAQELIELRPFQSVDDLTRIKGIGEARIKDIKEQGIACVGGKK